MRLLISILLSMVFLLCSTSAWAQAPAQTGSQARVAFSPEHRQEIYRANKKSHSTALVLSLAFPGIGNFYAEQYMLGAVNVMVGVFGWTFFTYGLVQDQSEFLWLAAGFLGVGYLEGMGLALWGVSDYNAELRRGLKIEDESAQLPRAPGFAMAIRF